MKRFFAALFCVILCFICGIPVFALESVYTLTPANIGGWSGTPLQHISNRGDYFCVSKWGAAELTLEAAGASSIHISFDAGNYEGEGSTTVMVQYISGGDVIKEKRADIPTDGRLARYETGSAEMFAGLPEGTEQVRITIDFPSGSGRHSAYFRNFTVALSSTTATDLSESSLDLGIAGSLGNLEVRTTESDRFVLIAFVCAVAAVMMAAAKIRENYKKRK